MAGRVSVSGQVAREYARNFPELSTRALAIMLFSKEPMLFNSFEHARSTITWHRGERINRGYKGASDPIERDNLITRENPFGIPPSYRLERKPFVLPKVENNILLLSDLHIPYHEYDAIKCALDYGAKNKVNTIFINGDLLDNHNLSRYEKDRRKRSQKDEIEAAKQFLTGLRKSFPKAAIYYHFGNHDIRYQNWLKLHPEIFDDPYFELETRLGLINLRIKVIDDKTITKAGKLSIHHGHYIFKGQTSPVSPARTILLKAKQSMACGHTHKISEATALNLDGEIYSCWSTGSLCELTPDYSPMCNDYAHGFAHANIHADGSFTFRNFRIKNGRIL